eukprot:TRINITY_DN17896_c0_g1_i1.p1 TRINITY_DN17896_c0_g1~~TRINITY_DN17896_c0_g1_i1.p1  ORF type:complete len:378 (+),score=121.37 TRINITY_DN17896_c0_g1_i1:75-1136(+)
MATGAAALQAALGAAGQVLPPGTSAAAAQQHAAALEAAAAYLRSAAVAVPAQRPAPAPRPAPAGAEVEVSGARHGCSGRYRESAQTANGHPVWCMVPDGDRGPRFLFSTDAGFWMVTDTPGDFSLKGGSGFLCSAEEHRGRPPHALREWKQLATDPVDPAVTVTQVAPASPHQQSPRGSPRATDWAPRPSSEIRAEIARLCALLHAAECREFAEEEQQRRAAVGQQEQEARSAAAAAAAEEAGRIARAMAAEALARGAALPDTPQSLQYRPASPPRHAQSAVGRMADEEDVGSLEGNIVRRQIREVQSRLDRERTQQGVFDWIWGGGSGTGLQCDITSGTLKERHRDAGNNAA